MERIVSNKTVSGDWILAGGKIERVLKDALNEQFKHCSIEIVSLRVMSTSVATRLDCPRENMVIYTATASHNGLKSKVSGTCECYLNVFSHETMHVLYNTYMRVYWKVGW